MSIINSTMELPLSNKTIMVFGTRNPISISDEHQISSEIRRLHDRYGLCTLIHETRTCVDKIAFRTATILGWHTICVSTNWKQYKSNAPQERNMYIYQECHPDILLAFPGPDSKGTIETMRDIDIPIENILICPLSCRRALVPNM